ncbi:efflux transporter, outer membrane factor (OMF) lipoprotein, NodT family [Pseudomonas citronellolis]|uniref:Efflux transporter, outer membrane factor (OMF) lipoprotein, NodT family n=1 Tax=Pseudomonas citronellolis TaxID=53408 RepID=A0AAQ1HR32_9PSED|nr:efflux transporter outer membrane subunit [Pseudomonas citronellolis]MCP1640763.1 NodT family efflux transporter outer membrane factor (OMF) lipoprotein [Pseudomonas citronellolis]MCP1663683.1 NodT family efflux transporter outer membrane factor (OMF) lipoprotein [Pseudomonas citronellolis]MCP1696015.1 NodT family efflux transporter outer membrane factor (OMF) lipoprotein [Pseudomonas citronellolis]MCP1701506.1 NodT family efflux transporter outer membrane factor (OMF) lipoprotein [Pseudomon
MKHAPLLLACLALGACSLGPDFRRPDAQAPAAWNAKGDDVASRPAGGSVESRWWKLFNDPQLDRLQARVAAGNLDLQAAAARLEQSRAIRRALGADAVPQVDGNAGYARQRNSEVGLSDPSGEAGRHNFNQLDAGFTLSWELDLWGRVRRELEAADAQVQASEASRHDVLVAVLAESARDYVQLRGEQGREAILRGNLDIARHSLQLTQLRRAEGVATELDVAEAKAQVAVIESQLPGSQKRQARLLNALAFLLGEQPGALAGELAQAAPIPRPPQAVPVGLPAELARRRPDIRQAEAVLHAATASIGVAQADFYPRISLNGDFGFQALQLANFGDWNSRTFGIGPSLHLPIFEGGRLKGTLALREAQQKEAAIAYRRTVLNAWREVDDALNDYAADQRELAALDEAVEHGRTALANAREQYKAGAVDFLNVLSAQRELLASEERQVRSSEAVGVNLALLYKALGGGWES